MKIFLALVVVVSLTFSSELIAQSSVGSTSQVRRSLATVMFAGLGGAVIGLSTLSFYGEPQDNIGNIWTGMAIGAIAGSVYVVMNTGQGNLVTDSQPNRTNHFVESQRPNRRFPIISFDF